MKTPSWLRPGATPLTLAALAVALLAVLSFVGPLALHPLLGPLLPWLAATLFAAAAALHRPFGGRGLAAGAVALPTLVLTAGVVAAAWAAFAAVLLAELVRTQGARTWAVAPPVRRRPTSSFVAAGRTAATALAAGVVWNLVASPAKLGDSVAPTARIVLAGLAAVAAWTAAGLLLRTAERDWRLHTVPAPRPAAPSPLAAAVRRLPRGSELGSLGVEVVAWLAGSAVAATLPLTAHHAVLVPRPQPWLALALIAGYALVAVESARLAGLRAAGEERLGQLDRVRSAGQRMVGAAAELEAVVDRIRQECANVVPFGCFAFDVLAADGRDGRSWWATAEGELEEGEPEPDPYPPVIPGIHRRPEWRLVERALTWDERAGARLTLWCDPRRLDAADLELLDALLPQMVASIRQSLLDREAREDRLTGAAVRWVLETRLFSAFRAAVAEGAPLAVIMCDLDRFKRINDTFGHLAGDRALALVGAVLARHKRASDLLARYGGEEFTLLLEQADGGSALAVAERLRQAVEEIDFEVDGTPVPLTVSAGVSAFPELTVKTPTELILLADGALYEAKRRGRNRCLLDLGAGRYRGPTGHVVMTENRRPTAQVPRIFA